MHIQNTNQTQYTAQPSRTQHNTAKQSTLTQTATSLIGSNKTLLEATGTQAHILQFMHKATDIQIQELTAKLNDTLGQGSSGAPQHVDSLHPEFQALYINTHQHITSLKKLAARDFRPANNNPDDHLELNLTAKGMGGGKRTNAPMPAQIYNTANERIDHAIEDATQFIQVALAELEDEAPEQQQLTLNAVRERLNQQQRLTRDRAALIQRYADSAARVARGRR